MCIYTVWPMTYDSFPIWFWSVTRGGQQGRWEHKASSRSWRQSSKPLAILRHEMADSKAFAHATDSYIWYTYSYVNRSYVIVYIHLYIYREREIYIYIIIHILMIMYSYLYCIVIKYRIIYGYQIINGYCICFDIVTFCDIV